MITHSLCIQRRQKIQNKLTKATCSRLFATIALGAGIVVTNAAHATDYTAYNLGTLGGSTNPTGLNASGQVVGSSQTSSGDYHAFITGANGQGMTDLGALPGASESGAYSINVSGQIVGYSQTSNSPASWNTQHGFITGANGQGMTDVGTLGEYPTIASGINDNGQVVGTSYTSSGIGHAFITGANGQGMTDLGTLGGNGGSGARAINAIGQVAGSSSTTTSSIFGHAFITGANGQGMTDLGTLPGNNASFAVGINASGQVVGTSATFSNNSIGFATLVAQHAFITGENGQGMTDLGDLGGSFSVANGINNIGEVVGTSSIFSGAPHAFITGANGMGMTDLNSMITLAGGDYLVSANAINDNGQIVANSSLGIAYLLTPVPEPESYLMMTAGLILIGVKARRRYGKKSWCGIPPLTQMLKAA